MGLVVVISLPLIFFCLLLGFGCYFFGKYRGRKEVQTNPQVFGVPTPPPDVAVSPYLKPNNSVDV